jgi:lysophospholipase L1-like esterase
MFRWNIGWEVWLRHYENRALNFGLGSDRTEHALWRLDNIDLTPWAPKVAVVLIGTNNFRDTPDDIAAGVKAVVEQTKALFSGIKVIVVSILPNARAAERMAAANQLIAKLANGKDVFYLDLAAKFPRDEQANSWKGLARDKLHLTEEGYETWAQAVDAMLPELLK